MIKMKRITSICMAIACIVSCFLFSGCDIADEYLKSYNEEERREILAHMDTFETQGECIIYDVNMDIISYKGEVIKCKELSYNEEEVELLACSKDYFYVCAYTLRGQENYTSTYDMHLLQGDYQTLDLTLMQTIENVKKDRFDRGIDKDSLYVEVKIDGEKTYCVYNVKSNTMQMYENKHEFISDDNLYRIERMDMDLFINNKIAITNNATGETKTIHFSKDGQEDAAHAYITETFNPFWHSSYNLTEKDGVCYILSSYALEMMCQNNILVVYSYDFETEKLAYHSYIQWNEGDWYSDVIPEFIVLD